MLKKKNNIKIINYNYNIITILLAYILKLRYNNNLE